MDIEYQRNARTYQVRKKTLGDPLWERKREYKIVILDVSIFFTLENPWYWLKKYFDVDSISLERVYRKKSFKSEYEAIYRDIISLKDRLRKDPLDIIEEAFKEIPFILCAEEVIRLLNSIGSKVGVVGGAHEIIIKRISSELGLNMDFYDYVRILRDNKGSYHILGGLLYNIDDHVYMKQGLYGRTKLNEIFNTIITAYEVDPKEVMIIARDDFFKDMLERAGMSIVFNPIGEEFVKYVESIGGYIITGHMNDLKNFLENVLVV
ncbi:MAG: hypothetical protein J7K58_03895 [Euryarchaeota archaeon]|nr:hypothetical protein [Euryarchaeota archaeon]